MPPLNNGLQNLQTWPTAEQPKGPFVRKKVWWSETPKLPHNETPLSPKDEQQANPQHDLNKKEGQHGAVHQRDK